MNDLKFMMLGRITKNIILIYMGMVLGGYFILKGEIPLAKTDYIILLAGLGAFILDFMDWYGVFVSRRVEND